MVTPEGTLTQSKLHLFGMETLSLLRGRGIGSKLWLILTERQRGVEREPLEFIFTMSLQDTLIQFT